ncbi:hypothetical protein BZ13_1595 [Francisella philomiragia subsp. philomiragia ATCC 25015]|uniref:DUF3987 domain-containing protein n=1 Tax=Francisella philomiragia TaxID=28110 RepID=UPI0001AF7936|nr:DUF3987 domain-containing protein [Francisella philomiragia]AJI75497.1 hypothetical protein BZ13_1595 [Francisella philomiragia subsp. philomiragia ATCC 25015]EET20221.1 conserved hypothetical protein [Francisella philomiragia subsp. philomiragia ATCC 25015]
MKNSMIQGKPLPIEDNRKPIPQLDINILPTVIKDYVEDLSKVLRQPKEALAVSVLVSLAGLLGNKVALNVDDSDRFPILWGLIYGESGAGKTQCIYEPTEPVRSLDIKNRLKYEEIKKDWETVLQVREAEKSNILNKIKKTDDRLEKESLENQIIEINKRIPPKPFSREIVVEKITPEKVAEKIANYSPNGLFQIEDEGIQWLNNIAKSQNQVAEGFYKTAYNAKSYKVDTLGRGTQLISILNVSLIAGVQPEDYRKYLNSYTGGGIVARFQMIAIVKDVIKERVKSKKDPLIEQKYKSLVDKLHNISERITYVGSEKKIAEPKRFYYSENADYVFSDWFKSYQLKRINEKTPLIKECLNKLDNTFHTLALIFHLAENGDNEQITEDVANRIITFIYYLMACFKYLYEDDYNKLENIATDILDGKSTIVKKWGSKFTVARAKNSTRRFDKYNKEEFKLAIDILESNNYIKKVGNSYQETGEYSWL